MGIQTRKLIWDKMGFNRIKNALMANPFPMKIKSGDNERIIYLCGPHGVGKSTLIESLKEDIDEVDVVEQIAHMETLSEMTNRQIWRISLHAVEHRKNLEAAKNKEDSFILGDRSTFDDLAYLTAFKKLGWITADEFDGFKKLTNYVYEFSNTPKPNRFIIVLPPYNWNVARIEERWNNDEEIKWRENDLAYLEKVREAFEELSEPLVKRGEALLVRDTDAKIRMDKIRKWLTEKKLIQGTTYTERQPEYRANNNSS